MARLTENAYIDGWAHYPDEEFGSGNYHFVNGNYAHIGDVVTCENGHPICEFSRDVGVGELFDPAAMTCWQQTEPDLGTMAQPCKVCGARWFKGQYFHFSDGWRLASRGSGAKKN